jgi:hypothetical protein
VRHRCVEATRARGGRGRRERIRAEAARGSRTGRPPRIAEKAERPGCSGTSVGGARQTRVGRASRGRGSRPQRSQAARSPSGLRSSRPRSTAAGRWPAAHPPPGRTRDALGGPLPRHEHPRRASKHLCASSSSGPAQRRGGSVTVNVLASREPKSQTRSQEEEPSDPSQCHLHTARPEPDVLRRGRLARALTNPAQIRASRSGTPLETVAVGRRTSAECAF